jgi:hypothetical protein
MVGSLAVQDAHHAHATGMWRVSVWLIADAHIFTGFGGLLIPAA